jgi:hypothetical protein
MVVSSWVQNSEPVCWFDMFDRSLQPRWVFPNGAVLCAINGDAASTDSLSSGFGSYAVCAAACVSSIKRCMLNPGQWRRPTIPLKKRLCGQIWLLSTKLVFPHLQIKMRICSNSVPHGPSKFQPGDGGMQKIAWPKKIAKAKHR